MNIEMITTSFPKFVEDSHAPWILSIARDLVKKKHKVKVVAPSATDLDKHSRFLGVDVVRFRYLLKPLEQVAYGANIPANLKTNKIALLGFPFFILGFLLSGVKYLFKGDVVHAQFGYSGVFALAARQILRKKVPVIISFYGRDVAHAYKHQKIYKKAFEQAEIILVLSQDMKEMLTRAGCSPEKIIVHHLGVDMEQFNRECVKEARKDSITFIVVANFVEKKGIEGAVHALAKIVSKDEYRDMDINLRLIGRGPEEEKLRGLVCRYGLESRVQFINNYEHKNPRKTVIDEMQAADIFLLPSTSSSTDYGGTPIVLMEAGALCLPAIATRNAGNSEIIDDGKTGLMVEEDNLSKLQTAMESLMKDQELRTSMGQEARNYIESNFNHEKQVKILENIYHKVMKATR